MKDYIKSSVVILLLVFFSFSPCLAESVEMFIENSLNKHCNSLVEFEILKARKEGENCSAYLKKDGKILPIHTNGDWVIIGGMFVNNIPITNGELDKLHRQNFLEIREKLDEYVKFEYTPPKALPNNEFLYLIYDTNCTYCNQIKPEIKSVCDKYNIALKVILVSFLCSEPSNEIVSLFNSESEFLDFIDPNFEFQQSFNEDGITKIKNATKTLRKGGIFSTPTFIFSETGKNLCGVLNIQHLDHRFSSYFCETKENK